MKLEGSLTVFPLRELIEMVMYSSVTGVLEVHTSSGPGRLFFDDGRPYHAAWSTQSGIEAVHQLFLDPEASFLFVADVIADDETLWVDPIELLDGCEVHAQRILSTRHAIPGTHWIPATVQSRSSQVSIAEDEWRLLSLIDGQRSVDDIAAELFCDLAEVCESLQHMVERSLVQMLPPNQLADTPQPLVRAIAESALAPSTLPVAAPRRRLLDRLLDSLPEMLQEQNSLPIAETPILRPRPEDDPIVRLLRGS